MKKYIMIAKLCDDENNDVTDEMPTKKEKTKEIPGLPSTLKALGIVGEMPVAVLHI